jgi:hypothetical protein
VGTEFANKQTVARSRFIQLLWRNRFAQPCLHAPPKIDDACTTGENV